MRYARKNGLKVKLYNRKNINEIPAPSIIGTKLRSNVGHFIVLLDIIDNKFLIADSLGGRMLLTEKEFSEDYKYQNFAVHIYK